jgi:uncharacterized protein YraI
MRTSHVVLAAALTLGAPRLLAQNPSPFHDTTAFTVAGTALRAQPLPGAAVMSNLPAGWRVHVAGCLAGWCSTQAGSLSGFLLADSLSLQPPRGVAVAEPSPTPRTSIGVDLTTRLTVGISAGSRMRVAPEVSYVSQGAKSYGTNTQIGDYTVNNSDTELWLGLGVYWLTPLPVRPMGAPCLIYAGPRVGLAFASAEAKVDNQAIPTDATAKRTDWWLGFALGAELLLSPRFSVGAEGQVTKVFAGVPDVNGVTSSSVGVGMAYVDFETRGTLVLRFYP